MRKNAIKWGILIVSLPVIVIGGIQLALWALGLNFHPPHHHSAGPSPAPVSLKPGSVVIFGADTIATMQEALISHDPSSGLRFELYEGAFRDRRDAVRLGSDSTLVGIVDPRNASGAIVVHVVSRKAVRGRPQRGAVVLVYPSRYLPLF